MQVTLGNADDGPDRGLVLNVTGIAFGNGHGAVTGDDELFVYFKRVANHGLRDTEIVLSAHTTNWQHFMPQQFSRLRVDGLGSFVAEWQVRKSSDDVLLSSPPQYPYRITADRVLDFLRPVEGDTSPQSRQVAELIAEANKVRELCTLSRRQDYFDVPLSVLVEAQLRSVRYFALREALRVVEQLSLGLRVDDPMIAWKRKQEADK